MAKEDLPKPDRETAYMDNNRRIWLFWPDPPSGTGMWRIPGGTQSKALNPVMDAALKKHGVTSLRKMLPTRR